MQDHVTAAHATRPKPKFMSPYVALWAGLAGLAAVYLGLLAFRPDVLAHYWPVAPVSGEPETNEGQRATTDAVAEIKALKESVGQIEQEMAQLKSDVSAQSSLAQGWETRIAALETQSEVAVAEAAAAAEAANTKKGMKTIAAKADTATKKTAKSPEAAAPPALAAAAVAAPVADAAPSTPPAKPASAPAKPAAKPAKSAEMKVINAPIGEVADTLETGSVDAAKPAVTFGPAIVTSAPKPAGVVIGSAPSLDSLRLSWSLLSDRHSGALGNLQPRYTTGIDEAGLKYDLIAGPVASPDEAAKLCKDLNAKAIACRVSDYVGDAL